jgi:hypothetical protein
MEVSGSSDTVRVKVDKGPPSGGVCPHSEVQFTVQLTLGRIFATAEMDG